MTTETDIPLIVRGLTKAQRAAVDWLVGNGGLEVPNMNMAGRSREWPTRATLNSLIRKGVLTFEQLEYSWKVTVNETGLATQAYFKEQERG